MNCQAKYEPWVKRDRETHTCIRPEGHDEDHECPLCGLRWDTPKEQR